MYLLAGAAKAAAITVAQALHLHKLHVRRFLHKAELADACSFRNVRSLFPQAQRRIAPHIAVTAIVILDHAHAVRQQDAPLAKGRGAGNNVRIVTRRYFNGNTQGNDLVLQKVQRDILCCAKVYPFAVNLRQGVSMGVDFHFHIQFLPQNSFGITTAVPSDTAHTSASRMSVHSQPQYSAAFSSAE